MSNTSNDFSRSANPDAHPKQVGEGRPIATKRELEWLIDCMDHAKQNYEPPRPPGARDQWKAIASQLRIRFDHLSKRLYGQHNVLGDFQRATQNESKDCKTNPYKKRMLVRREFNDKAKDNVKDRGR